MAFKEWFPLYWFRAYPFVLAFGIAGLLYQLLCPRQYHTSAVDFLSGALIGLALVGAVFRRSKSTPNA